MHPYDNWKLLYEQYIYTQHNLNFLTYWYKQTYNGCRKNLNSSWRIYRLHLLENFRPTVANKSDLEVSLYFFPIDKHFIWDFHLTKYKNMEKLSPNRAQLFVRNKYTVFTMGGTVALRSVNNFFYGELQFCS